jgi:DNA-binding MarR family transcriptional regulator
MTSVKPSVAGADRELHAAVQLGRLMRQIRDAFGSQEWEGLRQSHFRLLYEVPAEGRRITDLAERLGMTKQAVGQFVTQLTGTGHVTVRADPADARSRIVMLTPLGETTITAVIARILRLEDEWAARVGPQRYRQFRTVLDELADGDRSRST